VDPVRRGAGPGPPHRARGGASQATLHRPDCVHENATDEFPAFLDKQDLPFESAKQARQQASEAHNRIETPLFAKSIERHAWKR